jgi:hypothetical protein
MAHQLTDMLKKYSVLIGIIIALLLLLIATLVYPGGSVFDKNAIGWLCAEEKKIINRRSVKTGFINEVFWLLLKLHHTKACLKIFTVKKS